MNHSSPLLNSDEDRDGEGEREGGRKGREPGRPGPSQIDSPCIRGRFIVYYWTKGGMRWRGKFYARPALS